jgi:hypothetical protein
LPHFESIAKTQSDAQAKSDEEFNNLVAGVFGKDNEKVLSRAKETIKEHAPKELLPHAEKLDNNSLAILAGVINGILAKYAPEDDLKRGGAGGTGAGGDTKDALVKELHALYGSDAWKDFQHADHEKAKTRVNEILAHQALKA